MRPTLTQLAQAHVDALAALRMAKRAEEEAHRAVHACNHRARAREWEVTAARNAYLKALRRPIAEHEVA